MNKKKTRLHVNNVPNPLNEDGMQERAILIRNDLLSANYQNRSPKVGIGQVLNRLLMFLQEPYVIVIVAQSKKANKYQILYHTLLDPLWKSDFEKFLIDKKNGVGILEEDWIYIDCQKYKKSIFHIFDKEYFMFFKIEFKSHIPHYKIIRQSDKNQSDEVNALEKLFNEKTKQLYLSENLSEQFHSKKKYWEQGKIIISDKFASDYDSLDNKDYDEIIKENFEGISRIFNEEYKRIWNSPLLFQNKNEPPNIIFFLKHYIQDKPRYHGKNGKLEGCYKYNVRVIIPDMQKEHIRSALQKLSKRNAKTIDKDKKFPGHDDFFWEEIKSDEGIDNMLRIMESSFQSNARSLSDPTLSSGYVHINHSPFPDDGSHRLENTEWNKGETSNDYRRLVYYHYVMSMMASITGKLSAITVPGSVGGSTWFCMTFLSRSDQDKQERWLDNYHFYHSICHYTIRGIRKKIKNKYLEVIKNIYSQYVIKIIDRYIRTINESNDNRNIDVQKDICDGINYGLSMMARIYPFSKIQFRYIHGNNKEKTSTYKIHRILNSFNCEIIIIDNPFFINDGNNFMEDKEIMDALFIIDRHLIAELQFQNSLAKN